MNLQATISEEQALKLYEYRREKQTTNHKVVGEALDLLFREEEKNKKKINSENSEEKK